MNMSNEPYTVRMTVTDVHEYLEERIQQNQQGTMVPVPVIQVQFEGNGAFNRATLTMPFPGGGVPAYRVGQGYEFHMQRAEEE